MVASLAIPAAITLATVQDVAHPLHPDREHTKYGYTVSLLMFVFPSLLLLIWRIRNGGDNRHLRALWWSGGVIAVVGFVLDLFFGYTFFVFPNPEATLQLRLSAWSFADRAWMPRYLPVEEFGFYILGSLFVVAMYMWADAEWLCDYEAEDYEALARSHRRILRINWWAMLWWFAFMLVGILFKRYGPVDHGFPGYFLFIMVLGFLPTVLFLHTIRTFVNWRAFGFAYGNLTLVSLLWEATLGVPYNWWNYNQSHMLGIRIAAWANLPIEAVLLWLVVAWDCIIAYEIFRVFFHMDRSIHDAMLGTKQSPPTSHAGTV